jgi:hypothetical protein
MELVFAAFARSSRSLVVVAVLVEAQTHYVQANGVEGMASYSGNDSGELALEKSVTDSTAADASGAFGLAFGLRHEARHNMYVLSRGGMYDGNRCRPSSDEEDFQRTPGHDGPQLEGIGRPDQDAGKQGVRRTQAAS